MAKITRQLSEKFKSNGKNEILLRVTVSRVQQYRLRSGIYIAPERFKNGIITKPRANRIEAAELQKAEADLLGIEQHLLSICTTMGKDELTKEYLADALNRYLHPDLYQPEQTEPKTFFDIFDEFLTIRNLSEWRVKHYKVLIRALKRFEAYCTAVDGKPYTINLDNFDVNDVNAFEAFLRDEPAIAEQYPAIYAMHPADTRKVRKKAKPLPKGNNTIVCLFSLLRAFFNWCNGQGLTDNKPFAKYSGVTVERYGTPYYITSAERDVIADFDLSAAPDLEIQRDIFVFHCFIGCRVSDLMRLTPANVITNAVEYIANKTKGEHPDVLRVPLHPKAAAILAKYAGTVKDGRLLPFISPQRYNDAIKKIFTICGITRQVTILDPLTGNEVQRPINEVASSHMARRTFVGNLYKQVKDPNLIGKLSGHCEGSRAFARYRDIDEDIKRDLINLL
jgi:integrase